MGHNESAKTYVKSSNNLNSAYRGFRSSSRRSDTEGNESISNNTIDKKPDVTSPRMTKMDPVKEKARMKINEFVMLPSTST
jgi:hypothetical protein